MPMFNNPYSTQTNGFGYTQNTAGNWVTNQPPTSSFAWIQGGKATANAYPVAPGNTVYLIDSELPIMFKKSADQTGRLLPMETVYLVSEEEYNSLIATVELTSVPGLAEQIKAASAAPDDEYTDAEELGW